MQNSFAGLRRMNMQWRGGGRSQCGYRRLTKNGKRYFHAAENRRDVYEWCTTFGQNQKDWEAIAQ